MHAAGKPGIDPAELPRPCDDAPGLEVSLGKLLEHGFIKLSICKEALKARVLLLKLLEAFGLCGFHSPVEMLPAVVSRRRNL
jgi:hypothetical protein